MRAYGASDCAITIGSTQRTCDVSRRINPVLGVLLVVFTMHCTMHADAATLAIAPSADTYIETYGSQTKNFGDAPQLRIDQWEGRKVLLRFPLTDVPQGKRVLRAVVRLYVTDVGFNEQGEFPDLKTAVALADVVTSWTETGATFNTYDGQNTWHQGPGIGGQAYGDVGPLPQPDVAVNFTHNYFLDPTIVTKGAWMELDVTDFIRQRQRAGDKEVSLLLRSSNLARNWTFASREAKEAAQHPQLAVETSDTLEDFQLPDRTVTNWTGKFLGTPIRTSTGLLGKAPAGVICSFLRKPGASRLDDNALKIMTMPVILDGRDRVDYEGPPEHSPLQFGAGVAFTPDVPGLYRIKVEVPLNAGQAGAPTTSETADVYVLSVPPHPRLYVNPQRIATMRQQFKDRARLVTAFVDWVDKGNANLPKGGFHDMQAPDGCENNALAYLVTGDKQYAQTSIAYTKYILDKPLREHFKDVHDATFTGASWAHAVAMHYDWCYDQLTAEQRKAIADWLKEAATWGEKRSGAPIAHNDGGGRQILLSCVPLALLGDDPDAPKLLKVAHENFDKNLLPWLNDGGRGGRSGDGGEYEGLHGFFIVRYAWMARSASGEDVFSESPYFFNRISHVLFGWYPRKLVQKDGLYSMRQYYSPAGDHIRLGYVGDTQPYMSAAALCDRYRDTPEAQALRWLAGDWPTQWMQYTLKWAVLGDFDSVPKKEPAALAYLDPGMNTAYMRSDWSDDATWILFENPPFVSVHDSLYSGGFEIFKGDLLAARTGNLDHGNVGTRHSLNWLNRTIATNGLLINDPAEKWRGFLGGAEAASDGGGQRTNFPLSASPGMDDYLNYRHVFQRGSLSRFKDTPAATYAYADITAAYNSAIWHGGKVNQPKVSSVTRQLMYLRPLDALVVYDRVSSTNPQFKKTWVLHSLGDLDVQNGREQKVDDGEFHYTGATQAVIRYGWPKPVPGFGRCLNVTLLPENAQITKIGGRVDLPDGKTEGFPGDQWHQQHHHHHIKDFWVNGADYAPGNPPEVRWFGEPGTAYYVPGTPDETGGRGKWRIEVSPATPAADDVFMNVLCPRLGSQGAFPTVTRLTAAPFDGALVTEGNRAAAAFFSHTEKLQTAFAAALPAGKGCQVAVTDLSPGQYTVTVGGKPSLPVAVGADGVLQFTAATGGAVQAIRR